MKTVDLETATATELSEFANTTFGLSTNFRDGKDKLISALRAAGFDGDEIEVEEVSAIEPVNKRLVAAAHKDEAYGKKVRLTLNAKDAKDAKQPQFVAVNGVGILIPKGKEVEVPYPYYEALKNAVRREYETDDDGKIVAHHDVPQHAMQVTI